MTRPENSTNPEYEDGITVDGIDEQLEAIQRNDRRMGRMETVGRRALAVLAIAGTAIGLTIALNNEHPEENNGNHGDNQVGQIVESGDVNNTHES